MAKKIKEESNPFSEIVGELNNDYISLVDEGLIYDCNYFIDTGSYIFNGLLSGSIWKGLPGNKITALAGAPATGKTYFVLEIIKNFLDVDPKSYAFIFESEGAIGKDMLIARGVDPKRVYVIPVATIEEFRTQAQKLLSGYLKMDEKTRPKMLIALDSLGMLSSAKETEDTESGKDKKDMTKPALIKGAFRVLTLKCARANVPMIITNHIYDVIGAYVPTKEMGGGYGAKFAASSVVFLSKKKMKDEDKRVTGGIITCNMWKSRFTREYSKGEVALSFSTGLDRYYGLLDFCLEYDVIKRVKNTYVMPDGVEASRSEIEDTPSQYFTPEVLQIVDKAIYDAYSFGTGVEGPTDCLEGETEVPDAVVEEE